MRTPLRNVFRRFRTLTLLLAAVALAGCATDDPDADQAATVSHTIVQLHADGTSTVTQRTITPAQQRAAFTADGNDAAARTAVLCSNDSLWLFDGPDQAGNDICFVAPHGTVINLREYKGYKCTPSGQCFLINWNGRVRSYYSGMFSGYWLVDSLFGPLRSEHFGAGEWHGTVSAGVQQASQIELP